MPKGKSSTSSQIHAVLGSDESEVKRAAKQLSVTLAPADAGEFGLDTVDGAADNVDGAVTRIHQTVEALLTLPFFGGAKLVWLKNVNFLGDSVLGRSATVIEALEKLTTVLEKGLPPDVTFLLSATEIDKRRSFYKTVTKLATVDLHDKIDASRSGWEVEAAAGIERKAREMNLSFENDALDLFTMFTGGDTRQIGNELEKLDLYLGAPRRVATSEDVRRIVPVSRAGVIFELGNAIARRNLHDALALLEKLLQQGESAVGILLVAIVPTVRNLVIAKDLMIRHRLPRPQAPHFFTSVLNRLGAAATEHLPRKKDGTVNTFSLGIAATQAQRYKLEELHGLLDSCVEANVQLVTSQLEHKVVLSQLIVKIISGSSAQARRP